MPTHRNHLARSDVVSFYRQQHEQLTPSAAREQQSIAAKHFASCAGRDVFELLGMMDGLVDPSDPDFGGAQKDHCVQTAMGLRALCKNNLHLPDWLPLVGLIHDLGKVAIKVIPGIKHIFVAGGDCYPVGVPVGRDVVLRDVGFDAYEATETHSHGCGFASMLWWGHDELMYQCLLQSKTNLPAEALYLVRFHSFYAWHEKRNYLEYADAVDINTVGLLRIFQLCDLYTKNESASDVEVDEPYFKELIDRYLPHGIRL